MALISCRECEHQVDGEAQTCPNCGISQPELTHLERRSSTRVWRLWLTVLAGALCSSETSVEIRYQEPINTGWHPGGTLGAYTVSGDLDVNTGVGASIEAVYLTASGLGASVFLQGSAHGSDAVDPTILMAWFGGDVRYSPIVGESQRAAPFLGLRLGAGLWSFQAPNPLTLENTSVTAEGLGFGLTAGVLGAVASDFTLGLKVSYDWMYFGDAGTEAFVFGGTDSHIRQLSISMSLYFPRSNND